MRHQIDTSGKRKLYSFFTLTLEEINEMETVITTLTHTITLNYLDAPRHSPIPDFELHFQETMEMPNGSLRVRLLKSVNSRQKWLYFHAPRAVDDFEQYADPTTYTFPLPVGARASVFINIIVRRVEQLLAAQGRLQKTQMTNHANTVQYYIYLR